MADTTIIANPPPGNYYNHQNIHFTFSSDVSGVVATVGDYPPSLSKYIAYDTLSPPTPFIAVTEDGRGRVLYDGGFPKLSNGTMAGFSTGGVGAPTTFSELTTSHKYFHNVIKWIANPAKAKKVLVIGDKDNRSTDTYLVKNSTIPSSFNYSLTKIITIAGFTPTFKDCSDYANAILGVTAAELASYAAVVFVSSFSTNTPNITTDAVNNLVAFREAGGGILIVTDHGYVLNSITDVTNNGTGFFKSANALASKFGAYFSGNVDRVAVNVGYLRTTYGDHPVYDGLLNTDTIAASTSESVVFVTQNTVLPPNNVDATTTVMGKNDVNLLLNMKDGSVYTQKLVYNIQNRIVKPFPLTITNAGRTLMNAAIANNTPITNYEVWHKAGTATITASTTSISGLVKMGIPEIAANVTKADMVFYIHLEKDTDTFFPRVIAIRSGTTILGAVSIDILNGVDTPYCIALIMKAMSSKAFIDDTQWSFNDVLSKDGFNELVAAQEKLRNEWLPGITESQTLYAQGMGTAAKSEPLLVEVDIIDSQADFDTAKLGVTSMEEVFNTWQRYSHSTGVATNESKPAELTSWKYDSDNKLIRCLINSTTQIGFISVKKYANYDLDVMLGSTNMDDDTIGIVAASVNINGEIHTLDIVRSCGGNSVTFAAYYNIRYLNSYQIVNRSSVVKWGNGNYGASASAAGYVSGDTFTTPIGWKWQDPGARVLVERRGDIIRTLTSDMKSDVLIPESEIIIDLNSAASLRKFKGSAAYGYMCYSQEDSYFDVKKFTDYDKNIVDIRDNKVYVHNGTNWVVDNSKNPATVVKQGKFAYSGVNKKLFFRDSSGILVDLTK